MRYVSTFIERLDVDYPGLKADIDLMLARGIPMPKIRREVASDYGIRIPLPQLWKYREKRWVPSILRIQAKEETFRAAIGALRAEWPDIFRGPRSRMNSIRVIVASFVAALDGATGLPAKQPRIAARRAGLEMESLQDGNARRSRGERP